MIRFTLIFALPETLQAPIATLARALADIIADVEAGISGFTVWPSLGWTKGYGIERGATVEFVAPHRRAVEFSAAVATWYSQECVYLASGSGAVLIDARGRIVETLAVGELWTCAALFNSQTEILRTLDND